MPEPSHKCKSPYHPRFSPSSKHQYLGTPSVSSLTVFSSQAPSSSSSLTLSKSSLSHPNKIQSFAGDLLITKGMENVSPLVRRDGERFKLPAGFRFHPTDEELIICYLTEKVLDSSFTAIAIGEADLNKCEPWDLPWRAKWGEEEWYFFSVRGRKYPVGQRANRATETGYWKATGKDKEVFREKTVIGMKKTLVFYKGRALKGEKTNWVMHEYRLQGRGNGVSITIQSQNVKNEWVLCRVFQKKHGGKKLNFSPFPSSSALHHLPPLTEFADQSSHVTCFSHEAQQHNGVIIDADCLETTPLIFSSSCFSNQSTPAPPVMVPVPRLVNPQHQDDGFYRKEQIMMRTTMMMENSNNSWIL